MGLAIALGRGLSNVPWEWASHSQGTLGLSNALGHGIGTIQCALGMGLL